MSTHAIESGAVTRSPGGPWRHLASDAATLSVRSLRIASRQIDALLMAIILPIVLMLLFTYVFGGAMDVGTAYVMYATPGIILLCAGYGASGTAIVVEQDMSGGAMDRFRSMPIAPFTVLTGHVVASIAKNLVSTAIVFGVAAAIGFRPDASSSEWLGAIGMIVLYVLAVTWVATLVGVLVRSADAANGFTFFILFLPYVSSAFVPPETMPTWLRGFAEHQFVTPITETIRGLLVGTTSTGEPVGDLGTTAWTALAWCVGISVLACAGAVWAFRRRR